MPQDAPAHALPSPSDPNKAAFARQSPGPFQPVSELAIMPRQPRTATRPPSPAHTHSSSSGPAKAVPV